RVQPRLHAVADGRHRLRLGKDLRIRPDADLQVLRPGALLDQHALELGRLLAAGHQLADIPAQLSPNALAGRVAPRDGHPLELGRLLAAGPQLPDIAPELSLNALAERVGLLGRAARLLL